ncbi:MAG: class I SAM-dependent methyltransferase [Methylovulum sp.]|nr:class I SAM-dependent methyltransferase [Methylovulum sp.]
MNKDLTPESVGATSSNHSPRRINTLADSLNAKTYLEVGVKRGRTFFDVSIPQKTAVDPKFLFDMTTVTEKNVQLMETTSDEFFSTLPITRNYDVIFLDGLHTFEQTYRDFCNSLVHSHERTVFLIDDTKPNDAFSAHPRQGKAIRYRKQSGKEGKQWHGDVYKVIFALHDFYPALNYRTILDSGNPQTLVWRSNNGWRKPLFNSMEAISRLSYFDLLDHIDILRSCSEEEAISLCLNELANL